MDHFDDSEKHFTVMQYRPGVPMVEVCVSFRNSSLCLLRTGTKYILKEP